MKLIEKCEVTILYVHVIIGRIINFLGHEICPILSLLIN